MPYTNQNVIALIAKAVKLKKGHIEGDIASQDAAYKAEAATFEAARQAAQSAFDTSYSNKEAAKDALEEAALQAALDAVQDARDAIVNDDGDVSVIDTLAEMEAQINAELASFQSQQSAYELALQNARDSIATSFGIVSDFTATFDTSYSSVTVVPGGSGGSGGSGGFVEDDLIVGALVIGTGVDDQVYTVQTDENGYFEFPVILKADTVLTAVGGYQAGDADQTEMGEFTTKVNPEFEAQDENGNSVWGISPISTMLVDMIDEGFATEEVVPYLKAQSQGLFGVDLSDVNLFEAKSSSQQIAEGIEVAKATKLLSAKSMMNDMLDLGVDNIEAAESKIKTRSERNSSRKSISRAFAQKLKGYHSVNPSQIFTSDIMSGFSTAVQEVTNAAGVVSMTSYRKDQFRVLMKNVIDTNQSLVQGVDFTFSKSKSFRISYKSDAKNKIKQVIDDNNSVSNNNFDISVPTTVKVIESTTLYNSSITKEVKQVETVISSQSDRIILYNDEGAIKYQIVNVGDGIEVQNASGVAFEEMSKEFISAINTADSLSSKYPSQTTDISWWPLYVSPVIATIIMVAINRELLGDDELKTSILEKFPTEFQMYDPNNNYNPEPSKRSGGALDGIAIFPFNTHDPNETFSKGAKFESILDMFGSYEKVHVGYHGRELEMTGRYHPDNFYYKAIDVIENYSDDPDFVTEARKEATINLLLHPTKNPGLKLGYKFSEDIGTLSHVYYNIDELPEWQAYVSAWGIESQIASKKGGSHFRNQISSYMGSLLQYARKPMDLIQQILHEWNGYDGFKRFFNTKLPYIVNNSRGKGSAIQNYFLPEYGYNHQEASRNGADLNWVYNDLFDALDNSLRQEVFLLEILYYFYYDTTIKNAMQVGRMQPGNLLYHTLNAEVFNGTANSGKATAFQQAVNKIQQYGWDGVRIADGGGSWENFFKNMYEVHWEVVYNHLHHEFSHNPEVVALLEENISLAEIAKQEKAAADAAAAAAAATAGAYYYYGGDGEGIGEDLLAIDADGDGEPDWWYESAPDTMWFDSRPFYVTMFNHGTLENKTASDETIFGFEARLREMGYGQGTDTALAKWVDYVRFKVLPDGVTNSQLRTNLRAELGVTTTEWNDSGISNWLGQIENEHSKFDYSGAVNAWGGYSFNNWKNIHAFPLFKTEADGGILANANSIADSMTFTGNVDIVNAFKGILGFSPDFINLLHQAIDIIGAKYQQS